jgi:hypothetical protein
MYAKQKQDKAARIRKPAYMAAGKRTQKTLLTHSDFSKTTQNKKHENQLQYLSSP